MEQKQTHAAKGRPVARCSDELQVHLRAHDIRNLEPTPPDMALSLKAGDSTSLLQECTGVGRTALL